MLTRLNHGIFVLNTTFSTSPPLKLSSGTTRCGRVPPWTNTNYCVTKASSETADPQEALAELRAGGYRLWSTMPAPAHGRSETYLAALDGRGGRYDTTYHVVLDGRWRTMFATAICVCCSVAVFFGLVWLP